MSTLLASIVDFPRGFSHGLVTGRYKVKNSKKLKFYNTFKHCYEFSSYLNLTRKTIDRKTLVRFLSSMKAKNGCVAD